MTSTHVQLRRSSSGALRNGFVRGGATRLFDYGFEEIARIVGKTWDNGRQISVRARKHGAARTTALLDSCLSRSLLDLADDFDLHRDAVHP